jgi:hypothetical protein
MSDGHKSGHIQIESIMRFILPLLTNYSIYVAMSGYPAT